MPKCKYYDETFCSNDCQDDWVKCSLCGKYLDWVGDELESNGYRIQEVSESCCDYEYLETKMVICPDCYERVEQLKKGD
jgi:hypothetical protein